MAERDHRHPGDGGPDPVLRFCLSVVDWCAPLVPPARREEWRREWGAEFRSAWKPGRVSMLRVLARTVTCARDAAWLRRKEWTMNGVWTDLRLAARALMRRPSFTVVATVTLAVALGANAALFTILDQVVIRPLPFPASERLMTVALRAPGFGGGIPKFEISDAYFLHFRENVASFDAMGIMQTGNRTLTGLGDPERVRVGIASADFFHTLGIEAVVGRTFLPSEERPGASAPILVSYAFWRDRFGRDPSIVGRTLTINGEPREVVGVLPESVGALDYQDHGVWLPATLSDATASPSGYSWYGIGRLAPEASVERAEEELNRVLYTVPERFPGDLTVDHFDRMGLAAYTIPLKEEVVGDVGTTLWLLLAAVGLTLAIAWANVANLVLVRAESRRREVAVRSALGAGRLRLLRHFASEGVLVASAAGVLGLVLAASGVALVLRLAPDVLPRMSELGFDLRTVAMTGVLAGSSALLLTVAPGVRQGRPGAAGLQEGGRGQTAARGSGRARGVLVIFQVALSLLLLMSSGLLVRSFWELRSVDTGLRDPGEVLTVTLTINRSQYATLEEARGFWRQLRREIRGLPGVQEVGMVGSLPLEQRGGYWAVFVEDQPLEPGELPDASMLKTVSVGYVEAMGVRLVAGRTFQPSDEADPVSATLVSEAFVRKTWPGQAPADVLGRRIRISGPSADEASRAMWRTVIGVVGDVRESGLTEDAAASMYGLLQPHSWGWTNWPMNIVVRTATDPRGLAQPVRAAIRALDPTVPVMRVRTMESVVAGSTRRTVFITLLMVAAAGVSLLLGTVGLYGVIAYTVAGRTQEIGVRMALGAEGSRVRVMVLRQGMLLAGAGVVVGGVASLGVGRFLSSLLFEVSPRDPATLAAVSLALLGVTATACWIPALRASRVDPVVALRQE